MRGSNDVRSEHNLFEVYLEHFLLGIFIWFLIMVMQRFTAFLDMLHFCFAHDRFAPTYNLSMPESDNQVIRRMGMISDNTIDITIVLPCWSADTAGDLILAGLNYFFFARGNVDQQGNPQYHGIMNRWNTNQPVLIDCGGNHPSCMGHRDFALNLQGKELLYK